jgi:hypothetical protein
MGTRYTVRRGDSLWSLSGRYLEDFTRYQDICDYHNEHVQRHVRVDGQPLIAITDANRIYVGQVLMIPGRGERPPGPRGTKDKASGPAVPIGAKTEFIMDPAKAGGRPASAAPKSSHGHDRFDVPLDLTADQRPGAPIRYGPYITPDYTMIGELSGRIVLEDMSPDRHRGNWELAICDDENVLKRKLKERYGQAFLELTSDMAMKFDPASGTATIRPRIAAEAGLGSYSFKVEADSPTHFSSTIDLKPIEGSLYLAGRKFNYSSKLSVKIDITLHPTPKGRPNGTYDQFVPETSNASKKNLEVLAIIGAIVVAVIIIATEGGTMIMRIGDSMQPAGMQSCPALRSPLWLTIGPKGSGPIA